MEELPPSNLLHHLYKRKIELESAIFHQAEFLQESPGGLLKIKTSHGSRQYYHVTKENKKGVYLPKKQLNAITQIAQGEYYKKLLPKLSNELEKINSLITLLEKDEISKTLDTLKKGVRELIQPVTLDDKDFAENWKNVSYQKKPFLDEAPVYSTETGLRVRSKSEMLIAHSLEGKGIPYRYEFPVRLRSENGCFSTFHPDFLCLNLRTRHEIYWEHFGMMDVAEYANAAASKLAVFEKNGIVPGKNLIVTMETQSHPISIDSVSKIIENMFLQP